MIGRGASLFSGAGSEAAEAEDSSFSSKQRFIPVPDLLLSSPVPSVLRVPSLLGYLVILKKSQLLGALSIFF
jgi:hypothetical protein